MPTQPTIEKKSGKVADWVNKEPEVKEKSVQLLDWINDRFPLSKMFEEHMSKYYAPKNFNVWYFFGSLAMLVLVIQIVSGIFLVMYYKPDATLNADGLPIAFASVEYIMRDVSGGWFIRYMHSTGASMFFIVVYLHMFRGLIYGSYKKPRELIWIFGSLIFLCLMAEAFMGYLLPWGLMSFWGAQVIINLFQTIPIIGPDLAIWIRGDFVVSDATLNRFFALHACAIPLVLIALVVAHILALHQVGSNNPDGVEIKKLKDENGIPKDGIPFHPYYTVHDIFVASFFLIIFLSVIYFAPEGGGYFLEAPNFSKGDAMIIPAHIAPVWYFTPFYAILRAVPSFLGTQVWGVLAMGAAVLLIALLPWLDRSKVKSIRYRGNLFKVMVAIFVFTFIGLGILGALPVSDTRTLVARILTIVYFVFFFGMPIYTKLERDKPVPERVTMSTPKRKIMFLVYVAIVLLSAYIFAISI